MACIKTHFPTLEAAQERVRQMDLMAPEDAGQMTTYHCPDCGRFHLATVGRKTKEVLAYHDRRAVAAHWKRRLGPEPRPKFVKRGRPPGFVTE